MKEDIFGVTIELKYPIAMIHQVEFGTNRIESTLI